ncbi:MAG: NAD(+)/NADH kinase [Acidimicrobiales bacterium]
MARIGFAPHAERPRAVKIAKAVAAWLAQQGHKAVFLDEACPPQAKPEDISDLDLLVSLGGDGTMLRAVRIALGSGVPVLGVNFGRFGYLTAAEPDGLQNAIQRFLDGDYHLERRMTIDAVIVPDGSMAPRFRASGLNDVVLARPSGQHTINASLAISGEPFLSYAADSMIVSTATGSTGYNLSARGPIISPKLRCIVVTPVSPHMLFDRSVVLDPAEEVAFRLQGPSGADLIVDGAACGPVGTGEKIVCRAGENDALLVDFGDRHFERVLKSKFHLADR